MRLDRPTLTAALPPPVQRPDGRAWRCRDGDLSAADLARAAGCGVRAVKRTLERLTTTADDVRPSPGGVVLDVPGPDLPESGTMTRAELAPLVAARLRIGRFAVRDKVERKHRENEVSAQNHPWKVGTHGRSVRDAPGGIVARLECSRCDANAEVRFRQLCDADVMDRKFRDKGWKLDPAKCPDHAKHRKGTSMGETAKPSAAAIQGQARMYKLLTENFDVEAGAFRGGYSDQRIAEECRLSVELVAAIRNEAFGELKEPPEIAALRRDIDALDALLTEQISTIGNELAKLRSRYAELSKRYGG